MTYLTQEEVGRRISELRAERGVSQRRLADALNVDPSALSRIESGERGLAVTELMAAADFLAIDSAILLRAKEDSVPLFRNAGGSEEAEAAVTQFQNIVDEFFAFEAAVAR